MDTSFYWPLTACYQQLQVIIPIVQQVKLHCENRDLFKSYHEFPAYRASNT